MPLINIHAAFRRTVVGICCLFVISAIPLESFAQAGIATAQQYLRAADAAYEAGDFESYTRALQTAHRLNPDSLYTRYKLACGYTLTGHAEKALELLAWLTSARVDFNMEEDPDLLSLADDERFQRLVAQVALNTLPINASHRAFTIPRLDLLPEGIAWDPDGQRFFLGSMRTGEIFAVTSDGSYTKFSTVEKDGPLSAIGMAVDSARKLLWVVGAGSELVEGFAQNAAIVSGVFAFALDNGELLHAYTRNDVDFGFNDVALAPNGDLYLSGSVLGYVPAGGNSVSILKTSEAVFGSNGIVVTPDGKTLITSSYPAGIAVIRISDGHTSFLQAPDNVTLYGIDGMYLYKGDLIAVQNGARPWRLMRFTLDRELRRIESATAIEFANKDVAATTGAIVGNRIHYVGRGPVPEHLPANLPENMRHLAGATVVMTAPLD